jgi:hypothetical protein
VAQALRRTARPLVGDAGDAARVKALAGEPTSIPGLGVAYADTGRTGRRGGGLRSLTVVCRALLELGVVGG